MNGMQPKTLTEAIRYYSDTQTCINAVALMRWQDGSPVAPVAMPLKQTAITIGWRNRNGGSAIRAASNSASRWARSSRIRPLA